MTVLDDLTALLKEENQAVRAFLDLLRQEQRILTSGIAAEMDTLPELTERKNAAAGTLEALARQRRDVLNTLGFPDDQTPLENWLAKQTASAKARSSWADTLSLAGEAREINRQNGELIAIRMQHNSRALETLQGAARGLNLYGPDGQYTPPGQGRINDAA